MRTTRVWTLLCSLFLVAAVFAWAQGRKPGLWEITTTMTWQQAPFPPGMAPPASADSPFGPGSRTTQICLTQAMVEKYGAPLPQTRHDCQIFNVQKSNHGMNAEMLCSGRINGKGTVASSWDDSEHAKGKVHFSGTSVGRTGTVPVEWTTDFSSVYKGADCGTVQPAPMPPGK